MKKFLATVFSIILMVTLTACGSAGTAPPANTGNADQKTEKTIRIKIIVGQNILTATLLDNATTRSFIAKFPLTLPMQDLYAREMCYHFPDPLPASEAARSGYEIGDLSYWTPCNSLVIFYKQNGEVINNLQKLGRIDSGVDVFEQTGDIDVTFELFNS